MDDNGVYIAMTSCATSSRLVEAASSNFQLVHSPFTIGLCCSLPSSTCISSSTGPSNTTIPFNFKSISSAISFANVKYLSALSMLKGMGHCEEDGERLKLSFESYLGVRIHVAMKRRVEREGRTTYLHAKWRNV